MAVPRSSSASQIQRKISGSLVGLQQQHHLHHHHHHHLSPARKFAARAAIVVCLLLAVLYLGIYLSALSAALNHAKPETTAASGILEMQKRKIAQQNQANALPGDSSAAGANANAAAGNSNDNLRKAQGKLEPPAAAAAAVARKETLVLSTTKGDIRIVLRPDLSKESVDYVKQVASSGLCIRCNLYRAEKPGILQGILVGSRDGQNIPIPSVKGSCPAGYETIQNDCPAWDASCGCHGPTMTRGMVGWAAGATGPDFFINDYLQPATWWGTQHTVWGELQDPASLAVLDAVWTLPAHEQEGLTFLDEPLHFELRLETASE